MGKYEVRVWEIYRTDMVIEADTAAEALKIGRARVENGEGPDEWVSEHNYEVVPVEPATKSEIATASALSQGWDIVVVDPATVEPQDYAGIPHWKGEGLFLDEIAGQKEDNQ